MASDPTPEEIECARERCKSVLDSYDKPETEETFPGALDPFRICLWALKRIEELEKKLSEKIKSPKGVRTADESMCWTVIKDNVQFSADLYDDESTPDDPSLVLGWNDGKNVEVVCMYELEQEIRRREREKIEKELTHDAH